MVDFASTDNTSGKISGLVDITESKVWVSPLSDTAFFPLESAF